MLVIRFARHGRKKQAFFKIVAADKARAVKKKSIAELGFYDPLADGGKGICKVDAAAVKKYIANGAQLSQTAARILLKNGINEAEKFIVKRVTKPKKEAPAPKPVEEATTETPTEDAPAKEKAAE